MHITEAFYNSSWQQPILLWIFPFIFLFAQFKNKFQASSVFVTRYTAFFTVSIILDAWLSAYNILGIGTVAPGVNSILSFIFIWLGDFRYVLLAEYYLVPEKSFSKAMMKAVPITFIIPLLSAFLIKKVLATDNGRVLYVVYEGLFVLLAFIYLARISKANISEETAKKLKKFTQFVVLYYGLWAGVDVLMLISDHESVLNIFAWGLRVLPNLLYYWVFVPLAYNLFKK